MDTRAVIGLVIGLVIVGLVVSIGLIVQNDVNDIMNAQDLGTEGNATRTTLQANIWSAFDLTTIIPVVMGASAIIGGLVYAFAYIFQRVG